MTTTMMMKAFITPVHAADGCVRQRLRTGREHSAGRRTRHSQNERGDDLVERLDALEEAKDAKGPKVADERELRRHKGAADGLCHADAADGDDEEVETVPAAVVAPEGKGEPIEVDQ